MNTLYCPRQVLAVVHRSRKKWMHAMKDSLTNSLHVLTANLQIHKLASHIVNVIFLDSCATGYQKAEAG